MTLQPLVDPIANHGDLAKRLADLRQLAREGQTIDATLDATVEAFHHYCNRSHHGEETYQGERSRVA